MRVTNAASGTNVAEIAEGVYRINTPVEMTGGPGAFNFNQYLVVDEEPLLFHTGPRRMVPWVREAVESVIPASSLRWIAFSHVEADECGSLNEWLAVAPNSAPVCGRLAALVSISDLADRAPRGLADGESLRIGAKSVRWLDAPHVPHGWECGFLFEETAKTLFCGDLFTQGGKGTKPIVETDIVEPCERSRSVSAGECGLRRAEDRGFLCERVVLCSSWGLGFRWLHRRRFALCRRGASVSSRRHRLGSCGRARGTRARRECGSRRCRPVAASP